MHDSPLPVMAVSVEQPGRAQPRGRVCIRAGCGNLLIGNDERPIYSRSFCSSDCRQADKRERMQEKRRRARVGKCPHCGRKFDGAVSSEWRGVASQRAASSRDSPTSM